MVVSARRCDLDPDITAMLSRCSADFRSRNRAAVALAAEHHRYTQPRETQSDEQLRLDRLLHRSVSGPRSAPLLRLPAQPKPGAAPAPLRRRRRHRLRRGHRGLQGPRHVLQHRRARRAVPAAAVPPEGDDISRPDRPAPQFLSDERAHGHHGSTGPHSGPLGAEQAADPEPAEAERGVHVAPRRPPARRVPAQRRVRVHRRILKAVRHVGDRRPARRAGRGPQGVP